MSAGLAVGLPATLAAGLCYGCAPVFQAIAARKQPPGRGLGLGLMLHLARQPLWLLGLLAEMAGFTLEVLALTQMPVVFVAPLSVTDLVVVVVLAARVLHERITWSGIWGIVAMAVGAALLALSFAEDATVGPPQGAAGMLVIGLVGLGGAVGSVALAAAVSHSAPRQRALWLGLGAGICYSASSLATREIGLLLRDGSVTDVLTSPAPYELVFFSVVAISLLQRALQTGSAVVAYPVMSVTANFVPVVVGLTVLGESLPGDWRDALFWLALAMLGAGIGLLGSQRAVVIVEEGPAERPGEPATSPLEQAGHPAG